MLLCYHSHHKCASRWAIAYIRELSALNYLSFRHSDCTRDVVPFVEDLAFFGNSSYEMAAKHELAGIHFVRNPLNIIVSSYFSHLNTHPDSNWSELTKQRRILRNVGLHEGLYLTVTFLERSDIGPGTSGPLFALRNWDYSDPRFKTVRIEDFVAQPSVSARDMLPFSRPRLPPDGRFSFEAFAEGRLPGQVNDQSHYRSGDPDEWKKYVPREIVQYVQVNFATLLDGCYPEIACIGESHRH